MIFLFKKYIYKISGGTQLRTCVYRSYAPELKQGVWSNVINNAPTVLADKMSEMNYRERSNFLLSGF